MTPFKTPQDNIEKTKKHFAWKDKHKAIYL